MKSNIVNTLGGKNYPVTLPCDASTAQTFAGAFLVGEWTIWEVKSTGGSAAVVTQSKKVLCGVINNTTGAKAFLGFNMPINKSEDDVRTALVGKTFNGVTCDDVAFYGIKLINH